jgi:cytochrome c peroxidase
MSFLMAFNHRPNPAVVGRSAFSDEERRGAELFHERCEACHEARLASDQPASRVPFERWEPLVMSREGAIVWGKAQYEQTGVLPYVHEKGARVPSLRRLYKKRPYFTNGSAKTLDDVLALARVSPRGFLHAPPVPDAGATLDDPARAALRAFLDLL